MPVVNVTADDRYALGMSLRELVERAAKIIVRDSKNGPNFEGRIDLYYDVEFFDAKIARTHRVRARVKITAASLLFDDKKSR